MLRDVWKRRAKRHPAGGLSRGQRRPRRCRPGLERLEDRLTPTAVVAEPAGFVGITPGHVVEVRQANVGTFGTIDDVNEAEALFALAPNDPSVAFSASDSGVLEIDYIDAATNPAPRGHFTVDRDIHDVPGNGFAAGNADDYAIHTSGFLFIPTAGAWNFTVNSDDGFRLRMGSTNALIAEFVTGKGPSDVSGVADVPAPGLYHYDLVYFERDGGSEVELFANGPGQATNALVGDPTGTIQVFQNEQPQADLSVTKADSPDPVNAGANLTYTITVTNNGLSDAQTVALSDPLPAGTTFVSFTPPAGWTRTDSVPVGGTGTITATIPTLAAGSGPQVFTLVVNVNANTPAGSTLGNTATVSTTTTDPNPGNDSGTASTTGNTQADLAVSKADSPDPVNAGANLTYTVTLVNNGPSDAQNVTLNDAVPANTTFVSAAQTNGPAFTLSTPAVGGGGTVTATAFTFANGAVAVFQVVVRVNPGTAGGTTITNTAAATSATTDNNAANSSASSTTTVTTQADLAATKTGPGSVVRDDNLIYTLTVTNNGPSDAANVALSDTVPANATFVSFTQTGGPGFILTTPPAGGPVTVTATAATLAAAAAATFELTVHVKPDVDVGATVSNTATVSGSVPDPTPGNNSATATSTVVPIQGSGIALGGFEDTPLSNVLVASFNRGSGSPPASAFHAVIDWGDGTATAGTVSQSGATYQVRGSHTYAEEGGYRVVVSVSEPANVVTFVSGANILETLLPNGQRGTPSDRFVSEVFDEVLGRRVDQASVTRFSQPGLSLLTQKGRKLRADVVRRIIRAFPTDFNQVLAAVRQSAATLPPTTSEAELIGFVRRRNPNRTAGQIAADLRLVRALFLRLMDRPADALGNVVFAAKLGKSNLTETVIAMAAAPEFVIRVTP